MSPEERGGQGILGAMRYERLLAVIREVHAEHGDDVCWLSIDRIFAAAGLPVPDRKVGDPAAMLANCDRFIKTMCAGGEWKSYAELEVERDQLKLSLAGRDKALELLNKGFESACDDRDVLKQTVRKLEAENLELCGKMAADLATLRGRMEQSESANASMTRVLMVLRSLVGMSANEPMDMHYHHLMESRIRAVLQERDALKAELAKIAPYLRSIQADEIQRLAMEKVGLTQAEYDEHNKNWGLTDGHAYSCQCELCQKYQAYLEYKWEMEKKDV